MIKYLPTAIASEGVGGVLLVSFEDSAVILISWMARALLMNAIVTSLLGM